jgi:polyhydroxybutyrate depolymerase
MPGKVQVLLSAPPIRTSIIPPGVDTRCQEAGNVQEGLAAQPRSGRNVEDVLRIALVVLLVLAVGCSRGGDDDAAPASTTTSASTTTPAVTTTAVEPAVEATGEVVHGSLATADGRTRTYRLYLPTDRADDAPLVLALHGGTGNGDQFARSSGYDGLAEANGFVVAYPDGTPTAMGERRLVWNAGGCCAAASRDDVDDVGFLTALVDQLADEQDLDPTSVLVVGHSNGAMMAMRLACEAADHVAAAAVQAGTVVVDDCAPAEPVSVMDLHGTDDRNVPIDGGVGEDSRAGVDFPPPRDALAAIATSNGCDGADSPTTRETDQADVTVESWGPCADGVDVELVAVEGAPHSWMDDASLRTWTFLSAHRG